MNLSAPQYTFLRELDTKYRAYVGGFGSGKTFVGCVDLLLFAGEHPRVTQGYFAPTYGAIRDIFYPTFEEAAHMLGYTVEVNFSNKEVHLYRGPRFYGTIICRSMDHPQSIIGFKIARALVDEIDTLKKTKAQEVWRKIIARMRLKIDGVVNGVGVSTTPEGFHFVYEHFAKDPKPSYSMVQASTYENERYLPDDYISTLMESYPSELIEAYIRGRFVNLTTGSVYRHFDRHRNGSTETVAEGEPISVGMDFNVGKMAACIFVQRKDGWHCVDEISSGTDTPSVCKTIKERHPKSAVTVYPDASGGSASSRGAGESDLQIIRDHGLAVRVNKSNPRVRDRVNAVNKQFEDGRLWVNTEKCPETARCLEQQPYDKNGEPDKTMGLDHQADGFGYPIAHEFPVVKPVIVTGIGMAQ